MPEVRERSKTNTVFPSGFFSLDEVVYFDSAIATSTRSSLYNAGSGNTITTGFSYNTSSSFVTPGTFATTSFPGEIGSFHWRARAHDSANNAYSDWQDFGPNPTSTDFTWSPIIFTTPANGTTTSALNLANWQLNAKNVTSTNSYNVAVEWGIASFNEASSSVNASGTALLSGITVSKPLYSGDYSEAGIPVTMNALASLYDITATSTFIATTTVQFTEQTIPGTSDCTSYDIQCISYQYDANGNITRITENASTSAARTVDYVYDDLNRLTSASSSNVASGSNYSHTYSYSAIGNLLSGSAGTYSYAHASSSYANPHALLNLASASTTSYAYDTNGNLTGTSIGSTLISYTWDWRNRMTNTSSSTAV